MFDKGFEGFVIGSASELRPAKRRASATTAVNSMAESTVTFEDELGSGEVRRFRSRRLQNR